MAKIKLIEVLSRYLGLSTDENPEYMPIGSKIFHTNTRKKYIYDGSDLHPDLSNTGGENSATGINEAIKSTGNALHVTLATYLDKNDKPAISGINKGPVTLAHDAITASATSAEIECSGFNSLLLEGRPISSNSTVAYSVYGSMISGQTPVPIKDKETSAQMTVTISASNTVRFNGIPDFITISANVTVMSAGNTSTLRVQPFNM